MSLDDEIEVGFLPDGSTMVASVRLVRSVAAHPHLLRCQDCREGDSQCEPCRLFAEGAQRLYPNEVHDQNEGED